ncbi:MAG: AAA family ATPase [Acidobacteria bacterium]|nr:AAA family ATPase [Acidobacteriota bacterium]
MSLEKKTRLKTEQLRYRFNDNWVPWESTREIPVCREIVGQDRALRAIRLGLQLKSIGYNIFVTGLSGTGKMTTIKSLLEELDHPGKIPNDLCYVNNFKHNDMPKILSLPAGNGCRLKTQMEELVERLQKSLPEILESDAFKQQWQAMVSEAQQREKEMVSQFEKKVEKQNFALVQMQYGEIQRPELLPVVESEPVNMKELQTALEEKKITDEQLAEMQERHRELVAEMMEISKTLKNLQKELADKYTELVRNIVKPFLEELLGDIRNQLPFERVAEYLEEVKSYVLDNLEIFQPKQQQDTNVFAAMMKPEAKADPFLPFQVNVIVDNADMKRAPVVIETTPNYANLFGTIERTIDRRGAVQSDFTRIKAGSILRANGGHLVINARDALLEPEVWKNLKRTLKFTKLSIQGWDPFYFYSAGYLKPEPIDIDLKVVMIGDKELYRLLYLMDEDFKKIFKIQADFDAEMKNTRDNVACFASLMHKICDEDKLLPFSREGIKAVLEQAIRLAGRQKKITTRFSDVADLLREASFWADKDGVEAVEREHVEKAHREKMFRDNLPEEKLQEMIDDNLILIDTSGAVAGQVNGLSVYQLGYYSFGKPTRITAEVSVGQAGIINIEREARMSGRTHDKGVLILTHFLRSRYTQDKPLSMNASLCFEQSYSGIDGDSASSTEVYALMSALADVPIRQDLAVTGSVNQKGQIQPIGGVNEKIEGFFDVCAARGLSATQGVIIPVQNVEDLMLREEIITAVKEGKFHIYAIATIDEGIELLTGRPAGDLTEAGVWPENTINRLVNDRLQQFADTMKSYRME